MTWYMISNKAAWCLTDQVTEPMILIEVQSSKRQFDESEDLRLIPAQMGEDGCGSHFDEIPLEGS